MKDYLLIWRSFPKLLTGAIFALELLVLFVGYAACSDLVKSSFVGLESHFSGPTLLVSIILVIALLSNLGVFGLTFLSTIVGGAIRRIIGDRIELFSRKARWISDLVEPVRDIALRLYRNNPTFYIEFTKLKCLALNELSKKKQIDQFMKEIDAHMRNIPNSWEVEAINYYTALSQDQRFLDRTGDDLQALWNLLLVTSLAFIISFSRCAVSINNLISEVFLLVLAISILSIINRRRLSFAAMLLIGYLDNFSPGPNTIEDREGEPML